jgi:hypothetical protein
MPEPEITKVQIYSSSNRVHVQRQLKLYFALGIGTQPFLGCGLGRTGNSQMKVVQGAGWWVIEAVETKQKPAHPPLENDRLQSSALHLKSEGRVKHD